MKRSVVALIGIASVATAFAAEVDITAAVRAAEAGTTELKYGDCYQGYSVDNAFGDLTTMASRVMLKNDYNQINWSVADDFEAGKPIVVTKYTLRRAVFDGPSGGGNDGYSCRRAPKNFYLQGSWDTNNWVTIDERTVDWGDTGHTGPTEMTFDVNPLGYNDFRHYRFVVVTTSAEQSDAVHCSFQYIKLFGTIGDYGTLAAAARPVESLVVSANDGNLGPSVYVPEYTPTLDSKIEIDLALTKTAGTQAIAIGGWLGQEGQMRLFHTQSDGWQYSYGSQTVMSKIKAYAGTRYKVTIDGPKVSINGVQIIDAGEKKTATAATVLCLFASPADADVAKLYNHASVRFYGLKAWKADGALALDLRPVVAGDGTGRLQDALTKKLYATREHNQGLTCDFKTHKWQNDLSSAMRGDKDNPTEPVVTLVEGEAVDGYPVTNAFSWGATTASRALFKTAHNVIQYDVPNSYHPGRPIVLARYAIIPPVYTESNGLSEFCLARAPHHFELQASKDGVNDWVSLSKVEGVGAGPGAYMRNGYYKESVNKTDYFGCYGCSFEIPEENRGDYRHYRFITEKSSSGKYDSVKMGFQEVRLFGYDGGFEEFCEPIEYVKNASQSMDKDNTYFKTGVTPTACNLAIEIMGSFTKVDQTSCLFCSRNSTSGNTWTLFLLDGALRLDCKAAGSKSSFKPEANKVYTIKAVQNNLYVDGNLIYTSGATDFVPGSEIVLMASHNALAGWHNQAQFKMQSCKITDIYGGVIRDYVAAKRSDGTVGLVDRANQVPDSIFLGASGTAAIGGEPIDADFWQRDRDVELTTELEGGKLPKDYQVSFAFTGNQRLGAGLYAAFDNEVKGNATNGWAQVVRLGDVKTGVDTLDATLPKNDYRYVKFFVCDALVRGVSHTKSCKTPLRKGLFIVVR